MLLRLLVTALILTCLRADLLRVAGGSLLEEGSKKGRAKNPDTSELASLTRLKLEGITSSMKAISYTAARENLASTMDRVCADHTPVIITRNRGQSVVMLSLEDFEALEETAHLLRGPTNAKRLLEAIHALESSQGTVRKIDLGA